MDVSNTQLLWAVMALTGLLLGLWGLICLLLRRHSRLAGLCMIGGCIAFVSHATAQMDTEAEALGFASWADLSEARTAGVKDAAVWRVERGAIRKREAAKEATRKQAQRANERKEQAKAAASAGFDTVAAFQAARNAGFTTKAAYDRHLAAEAFFRRPADQIAALNAIEAGQAAYSDAANDLARGAVRAQRKRAFCGHLRKRRATNWVGTITQLTTNTEGKGVISIKIGGDAYVKTWNNTFSDIAHRTLIDTDSSVFRKLAKLKEGDRVKFSGRFFGSDIDCVHEASLTLRGSLLQPEFIMRFTEIQTP